MHDLISLRLSAQRALTTNIPSNLRAACVSIEQVGGEYNTDTIVGSFFFDGEYSDDESDMVDTAVTEIISDFSFLMCDTKIYRVDYPQKMDLFDELVYLRYEPGYESYRARVVREKFSEVNYVNLRLSLQRALLGRVTPNLREIVVGKNGDNFIVYIYYNDAPTTLEMMLEKLVEADLREDFSCPIETKILSERYPNKIPRFGEGWSVYARYEQPTYQ